MNIDPLPQPLRIVGILVLLLLPLLLTRAALASERMMPMLDREVIPSSNRRYEFTIVPSDRNGVGTSQVTIRIDGKQSWEGPLPFTFWKAEATDDGVLIGYGYTDGYCAPGRFSGALKDENVDFDGEIVAAMLNAEGRIIAEYRRKRELSCDIHAVPSTVIRKHSLDKASRRLLMVMDDITYHPSRVRIWNVPFGGNGIQTELLAFSQFPNPEGNYLDGVLALRGTNFIVLDYATREANMKNVRHHAALIDGGGVVLWNHAWDPVPRSIAGRLVDKPQADRQFTFFDDHTGEEVLFEANQEDGRWAVREVARAASDWEEPNPWKQETSPPGNAASLADFPATEPDLLGISRLQLKPEKSSLIRIRNGRRSFTIDEQGRFAFLRQAEGLVLTVLTPDGQLLRDLPLDVITEEGRWAHDAIGSIGNGLFVVAVSAPSAGPGESNASPCVINAETGEVVIHKSIKMAGSFSLAAGHGMFVYQGRGDEDSEYAGFRVAAHRADGSLLWSTCDFAVGNPYRGLKPRDVAVTSDGLIAVLCKSPDALCLFGASGARNALWNLEAAWGRSPSHVASVIPQCDGSVIIEDAGGSPRFVRMNGDGTRAEQLCGSVPWMVSDPSGKLWYTDEYTLRRLDERMRVDLVLGHEPDPDEVGDLSASAIGNDGSTYLLTRRTKLIHVFAPGGEKKLVIRPTAEALPELSYTRPRYVLTPLADGSLVMTCGTRVTIYDREGNQSRSVDCALSWRTFEMIPQPTSGNVWAIESEAVQLLDPEGGLLRTNERRNDGLWVGNPNHSLVAADGSLLTFDGTAEGLRLLHTFNSSGEPRSSFALPGGLSTLMPNAFTSGLFVTSIADIIYALHEDGTPAFQFKVAHPDGKQVSWRPYFVADGRELWLYDGAGVIVKVRTP